MIIKKRKGKRIKSKFILTPYTFFIFLFRKEENQLNITIIIVIFYDKPSSHLYIPGNLSIFSELEDENSERLTK